MDFCSVRLMRRVICPSSADVSQRRTQRRAYLDLFPLVVQYVFNSRSNAVIIDEFLVLGEFC